MWKVSVVYISTFFLKLRNDRKMESVLAIISCPPFIYDSALFLFFNGGRVLELESRAPNARQALSPSYTFIVTLHVLD